MTMLSGNLNYIVTGNSVPTTTYSPPMRNSPLPSFGFTQEQVACVCEVSTNQFVNNYVLKYKRRSYHLSLKFE